MGFPSVLIEKVFGLFKDQKDSQSENHLKYDMK